MQLNDTFSCQINSSTPHCKVSTEMFHTQDQQGMNAIWRSQVVTPQSFRPFKCQCLPFKSKDVTSKPLRGKKGMCCTSLLSWQVVPQSCISRDPGYDFQERKLCFKTCPQNNNSSNKNSLFEQHSIIEMSCNNCTLHLFLCIKYNNRTRTELQKWDCPRRTHA